MALRQAVAKVIRKHRQTGRPLVLWQDGKVAYVPADQVELPDTSDIQALLGAEESPAG